MRLSDMMIRRRWPISNALRLTASGQASTVSLTAVGTVTADLRIRRSNGSVSAYALGDVISLADGEWVEFWDRSETVSRDASNYTKFVMTGSVTAGGNPMSLLNGRQDMVASGFRSLFYGCTSLVGLESGFTLPATTLASYCYYQMFYGCSSLTSLPSGFTLPATTLANYCYYQMFYACTALTKAPPIAATAIMTSASNACMVQMLYGCSALEEVEVDFTAWASVSSSEGTYQWLSGVMSTGTFKGPAALGTDASITRGVSYCPTGWTVVNTD